MHTTHQVTQSIKNNSHITSEGSVQEILDHLQRGVSISWSLFEPCMLPQSGISEQG